MHALGIAGPGADDLADRFVDHLTSLTDDRRVARVACDQRTADGGATLERPAATRYERTADGWRASGEDISLTELLDRLAVDHDYALLVDCPDADVPQVALGDAAVDDPLLAADDPRDLDPAAVVDAVTDTEPHETLESLVRRAKASPQAEQAGAIATFTGRVRAKEHPDDEPTEFLEFEKYEGVAAERMDAISADLEERDGVFEVLMHHRTGVIEYGRDIVFVVVLAGHREEAFRTVEDGINRLKDEVPIFKKEVTVDEEFWVHDRE
ncbi:molybdopterin synthase [Halobacteriales archaeon QS_1_68_17]|nr:MAG: molybdopterin synthase [Halobacteriales archaeon QS_1_68_17]